MENQLDSRIGNHPRMGHIPRPDYAEVSRKALMEGCVRLWQVLASMERIVRHDRPRGVMPETLDARPRSRGISQYWND